MHKRAQTQSEGSIPYAKDPYDVTILAAVVQISYTQVFNSICSRLSYLGVRNRDIEDHARDAFHQSYEYVYNSVADKKILVRSEAHLCSLLRKMAVLRFWDILRSQNKRNSSTVPLDNFLIDRVLEGEAGYFANPEDVERLLVSERRAHCLKRAIPKLSDSHRRILALHYLKRLNHGQIREDLGLGSDTASRKRLHDAHKVLKKLCREIQASEVQAVTDVENSITYSERGR